MRINILIFVLSCFAMFSLSRVLLAVWQWKRVQNAGSILPIIIGGLRVDAILIAMFAGLPILIAPWLGHMYWAGVVVSVWLMAIWLLMVMLEVSTPPFIDEYDARPNRLYVEYLKHPKEVSSMLWKGYKPVLVAVLATLIIFAWIGYKLFGQVAVDLPMPLWQKVLTNIVAAPLIFLAIRGTLDHRPMNPASVAYCGDAMLNTLPLNSLYSVLYAVYSMKNERSAADLYGKLPDHEVYELVNQCAGISANNADIPSLHAQQPTAHVTKPLNIVIIVEESLGAQYVNTLGGKNLTPYIDKLMAESWNFTRAYATGTRSVRGLEALVAGFPPTVSDAALRLSGAQSNFFTLAQTLKQNNYRSHFIYGGEAHFDNMKSFFLGNGFDQLHDIHTFDNPAFVGSWGASDEDMFTKLHSLLNKATDKPIFTLAFSVSNHSPWEYPAGRIQADGNPATVENTVRYADWALGTFFEQAKQSDYWDNTIFVVAADHDSRVGGASRIPLKHFHIPVFILGANTTAHTDNRIISQIDIPPTILSLLGISSEHPMIGHDLTRQSANRAMMQYGTNYGYLKGDQLVVLEPHKPASQYTYQAPDTYTPNTLNPALAKEALSHALWPTMVYKKQAYTLPHLRTAYRAELKKV